MLAASVGNADSNALIVSVIALCVSAAVAGWNVLKYVLDGGRVRVRLDRGFLDDNALHTRRRFKATGMPAGLQEPSDLHVELGVLRVENLGRTAVTVFEPSFDVDSRWAWSQLRIWRWTVQPLQFKFKDSSTESVVRIDPFDFVVFLLDLESGLAQQGYEKPPWRKYRRVRGSVGVAGKRLRRRSSWFKAWRLPRDARSLVESATVGQVAYRMMARAEEPREGGERHRVVVSKAYAAGKIQQMFDDGQALTVDSLREMLGELAPADDSNEQGLLPIDLHFEFRRRKLIDRAGIPAARHDNSGSAPQDSSDA